MGNVMLFFMFVRLKILVFVFGFDCFFYYIRWIWVGKEIMVFVGIWWECGKDCGIYVCYFWWK